MNLKRITKQRSAQAIFINALTLWVLSYFAFLFIARRVAEAESIAMAAFITVMALLYFGYHFAISRVYNRRKKVLGNMMIEHQRETGMQHESFNFVLSTLDEKEGIEHKRFLNQVTAKDWAYADFAYDIMRKAKHGKYRDHTVYYSVMAMKLPRQMPHVVFDSAKARKRQFGAFFAGSQKQSLEGNFDQHFTTYFPAEYHIDGRSLISPEVMEALIAADDYDVEITADHLFLYGDLREPRTQLADMSTKLRNIKEKLLHNAVTYRDENIAYEKGRQHISALGAQLALNLTRMYMQLAFGVVLIVAGIIFGAKFLFADNMITAWLLVVGSGLILKNGKSILKENRRRKLAKEAYFRHKSSV